MQEYVVPLLGAIGIILTAYAAVRKASEDSAAGAAQRWEKLVSSLEERITKLEIDRNANEAEIDAQQERIRELEQKERAAAERLLQVEQEHEKLKNEHSAMKTAFSALEARFERYRKGVVLLIKQIIEEGLVPVWQPEDDNHKES